MAKKKIYAVRKGHKTGLFYTWDECKKAVHGYSGAEYKGFLTKEEFFDGSNQYGFYYTDHLNIRSACCLCGRKF